MTLATARVDAHAGWTPGDIVCGTTASVAACRADLNVNGLVDNSYFLIFVVAKDALICPRGPDRSAQPVAS